MSANFDAEVARLDDETRRVLARRERAVTFGRSVQIWMCDERLVALNAEWLVLQAQGVNDTVAVRAIERVIGFRAVVITLALTVLTAAGVLAGVL